MAEVYGNQHATLTLRAQEMTAILKVKLKRGVRRAAEELKVQVQRNISIPTRSSGPSAPGEMPHADTGLLRNSIFWRPLDEEGLTAIVGTKLWYGILLEFGVATEKTVHAAPGKTFHWVNRQTGQDVFVKSFTYRGMKPRPFLRATLNQMHERISQIISGATGGAVSVERGA